MRQQDGPAPTASFPRRSELRADLGIGRPDNPTPPAAPVDWPATAVVHLLARGGRAVTGLCPRPSRRGFHVKHIHRSAQPERLRPPRPESPTPQPHRNAQCGQTAKGPSPVYLIERRFDPANDPVRFTAGPAEALDRAAPKGRPAPERRRNHVRRRCRPARPPDKLPTPLEGRETVTFPGTPSHGDRSRG
jgi:hypothetical protein